MCSLYASRSRQFSHALHQTVGEDLHRHDEVTANGPLGQEIRVVPVGVVLVRGDLLFSDERLLDLFATGGWSRDYELTLAEVLLGCPAVRIVGQDSLTDPDVVSRDVDDDPIRCAEVEWPLPVLAYLGRQSRATKTRRRPTDLPVGSGGGVDVGPRPGS